MDSGTDLLFSARTKKLKGHVRIDRDLRNECQIGRENEGGIFRVVARKIIIKQSPAEMNASKP